MQKKDYISILMDKARGTNHVTNKTNMSARDSFLKTEKELRRLNASFRSKRLTDVAIGNSIFKKLRGQISDSEIDQYANNHFTAAYYSFLDLKTRMQNENNFDDTGIKKYGYLINLILYDLLPFANHIGKKTDSGYIFFEGWKTNTQDSTWHYLGTAQLLYNSTFDQVMMDNDLALILSAGALRQTIELKLQRILGFFDFIDKNGQKVFTSHNFFFEFISDNRGHFQFDPNINMKIIQKTFEFCNESVHKGIMPYYWQMHYALKFCNHLFHDTAYVPGSNFHIHSAVKISDYPQLQNTLEAELKQKFPKPEFDIELVWSKPEAKIIE